MKSQKGSANHNAKLTEEDVKHIKEATGLVSQAELARIHKVDHKTIHHIQTAQTWQHLWSEADQTRLEKARTNGLLLHGQKREGASHPTARLTATQVAMLLEWQGVFSLSQLAKMFGVSSTHIWKIQKGQRWRCILPKKEPVSADEIRLLYSLLPVEAVATSFNLLPEEVERVWSMEGCSCQA